MLSSPMAAAKDVLVELLVDAVRLPGRTRARRARTVLGAGGRVLGRTGPPEAEAPGRAATPTARAYRSAQGVPTRTGRSGGPAPAGHVADAEPGTGGEGMDPRFLLRASELLAGARDPLTAVAHQLAVVLGADRLCVLRVDRDTPQLLVEVPGPGAPSSAPAGSRSETVLSLDLVLDGRVWGQLRAHRTTGGFAADEVEAGRAFARSSAGVVAAAHRLQDVAHRAATDALTGLANRGAFDERTEQALEGHRVDGTPVAVVMCDVNGLKQINDRRGHDAGDRHLVDVADFVARAAATVPDGLGARLGGDEFGLLLPGVGSVTALAVAEKLCEEASALVLGDGLACGVATTATSVTGFDPVDTVRDLMRLADAAQYRAKRGCLRRPVLVGPRTPDEAVPDRRRAEEVRRQPALDLLEHGLDVLSATPDPDPLLRLRAVGEACTERLDAAGWWVSHAAAGAGTVTSVDCFQIRVPGVSPERDEQAALGAPFDLTEYPSTAAALRGGVLSVELGAMDNDPAEEHVLAVSGFTAMRGAGATGAAGDAWLIEVYFDAVSAPPPGLEPVLRALVAAAVRG